MPCIGDEEVVSALTLTNENAAMGLDGEGSGIFFTSKEKERRKQFLSVNNMEM